MNIIIDKYELILKDKDTRRFNNKAYKYLNTFWLPGFKAVKGKVEIEENGDYNAEILMDEKILELFAEDMTETSYIQYHDEDGFHYLLTFKNKDYHIKQAIITFDIYSRFLKIYKDVLPTKTYKQLEAFRASLKI